MIRLGFLFSFLLVVCRAGPAMADAQSIGAFQAWSAYVSHGPKPDSGQDVCYVSAKPNAVDGTTRTGVFAEVTHRPAEHHVGVIDILQSYTFKSGSPATLSVADQNFTLFTHGVAAFAKDEDDAKIVAAMRAAKSMVFTGTDKKGKQTKDTFSLAGIEPAYKAISKACKVPIPAALKSAPAKKR